ncbi:MAG: arginase family protein, partial [Dehalococcoidia bacterium]
MTLLQNAGSMHRSAFCLNDGAYGYDFGPQHPLRPVRLRALVELVQELGFFDAAHAMRTAPSATRDELRLVHDGGYVDAVEALGEGLYPLAGSDVVLARQRGLAPGDTPAFPGMHESAAAIAGATLAAVRAVLRGDVDHAFSPSGGLHHAMAAYASG